MFSDNFSFSYFGHGGGEQYIRYYDRIIFGIYLGVRPPMLWGCSSASGLLWDMGEFDRTGTLIELAVAA